MLITQGDQSDSVGLQRRLRHRAIMHQLRDGIPRETDT
jgi:hypothetical protein